MMIKKCLFILFFVLIFMQKSTAATPPSRVEDDQFIAQMLLTLGKPETFPIATMTIDDGDEEERLVIIEDEEELRRLEAREAMALESKSHKRKFDDDETSGSFQINEIAPQQSQAEFTSVNSDASKRSKISAAAEGGSDQEDDGDTAVPENAVQESREDQILRLLYPIRHNEEKTAIMCNFPGCGKSIRSIDHANEKYVIKRHYLSHLRGAHICDTCFLNCSSSRDLAEHRTIKHFNLPLIQCTVEGCKSTFATDTGLKMHIERTHNKTTQKQCPECGKTFSIQSSLTRHLKDVHNTIPPQRDEIAPQQSQAEFTSVNSDASKRSKISAAAEGGSAQEDDGNAATAKTPTQGSLEDQIPLLQCVVEGCTATFATDGGLKRHIKRKHLKTTQKDCPDCGKTFSIQSSLTRHLKDVHKK